MFQTTRLKLTAWYLIIIMFVSAFFSLAIFGNVSRQIENLIRLHNNRIRSLPRPPSNFGFGVEELQEQRRQLANTLLLINLGILTVSGGAGYFLAGRTLRPIKLMIDEQNQFISDASHELRTPIATLRAEMEGKLLEKRISEKQARKLISSNLEELGALQNLSNSLLKIARVHTINNGKNIENISLREIIKSVCNKMSPLAKKKNIEIVTKVSSAFVKGGRDELTEVFVILLDNAIKYSYENSKITIVSENSDHKVKIALSDQGAGISKEDLPHIFERFFRADKSRSLVEGYGLGLSIAKKIVLDYKGSINVTSEIGKGSTFEVSLPLARL
ncbi:HAMP domain-containing histidine kinase [Patescibacteria group bacterium]|nr:HAMP domain-containing histidine kinase [Patescibacteria group bacterium]